MDETPLLTRAEAGLRPPRSITRLPAPEGLTAHYWGDSPWPASADRSSPARFVETTDHRRCASIWRAAQSYHMSPGWGGTINGGADVAYSSAVCPHGVRYEGRGPGIRTGAQGTAAGNTRSLATVYLAGGTDPLTDGARLGFLAEARRLGGWPAPRWQHGDWKPTACAGPSIRAWKAAGWPRPGKAPAPPTTLPVLPPTPGGLTMSEAARLDKRITTMRNATRLLIDATNQRIDILRNGTRLIVEAEGAQRAKAIAALEAELDGLTSDLDDVTKALDALRSA